MASKARHDLAEVSFDEIPLGQGSNSSHEDIFSDLSAHIPSLQPLSSGARAATRAERKMSLLTGCRLYPKAIAWSIVLSSTIIMEGYDTTLLVSFFTFPVFKQKYGAPDPSQPGNFEISSKWQSSLTSAAVVGQIIGLFLNGFLADRFGYRRTILVALVSLCLFIFLPFFAVNVQMFLAGQVLCGIPWGIFQTLATTYAAEVMPVALRAYILSSMNICWLIGQLCAVGVVRSQAGKGTEWAYRLPLALQWALAVPIIIGVYFAPESPGWLIRNERPEEARRTLLRLTTADKDDFNVDEVVAMMTHTNETEKYLGNGQITYLDCFKGINLRRTEIACMIWITQQASFSSSGTYAAYFYQQAGLSVQNSFSLAIGMYGIAIVGAMLSWFWMRRTGRRRIYLIGLAVSMAILTIAGGIGFLPTTNAQSWALGGLITFLTFIYNLSIGPICYVLVAEIPCTRLRIKTVILARIVYNVASIVTNVITPRMLNPTAWNWKGKSCLFFLGFSAVCFVWCYLRLPETFGLSYLEIDILFEKRAKASKFRELQLQLANRGYFSVPDEVQKQPAMW
ncbi:Major facilitator superfamily domain general substrate transporter [Penicillium expansum]|nr:Major facilitator superfamily domain general substrate transporter [Penicillium expansum]